MIDSLDQTPWTGLFPLEVVTPITAVHQGIEYQGEVFRAKRWSPDLGGPPGDGSRFKIVLVHEPPRTGQPEIKHLKTAVCVPVSGPGRQARRIIGEITAAKQAAYLTRRDSDAAAINSALRERRHDLQTQLVFEESTRFANGVVCVLDGPSPAAAEFIKVQDSPLQWTLGLAGWLLTRAYGEVPLATHGLTRPVRKDDAAPLFASIFGQEQGDSELLARLAPALGLPPQTTTGTFDPSGCRVFSIIRDRVRAGTNSAADLHRYLAHDVGITDSIASLFLLLFVHHERPEYQLQISDESEVLLSVGGALKGGRLTSDLIPLLLWDDQLPAKSTYFGPELPPRFLDARFHLTALCPSIRHCAAEQADGLLKDALDSIRRDIAASVRILELLEATVDPGAAPVNTGLNPSSNDDTVKLRKALGRLGGISGEGYAEVYRSLRFFYPAIQDLKPDLDALQQVAGLDEHSEAVFQAQWYIAQAQVPAPKFPSLAVDRETSLTGLSPSRLTRAKSRGWSAIARDAAAFKIRYIQAYREHHTRFHDALPVFRSGLLEAKKKAGALELLNTIGELGPTTGTGLAEGLAGLPAGPAVCRVQSAELDLSTQPYCQECRISLAQTVPSDRLARLAPQVDLALGEKTRELSRLLVEKALADGGDDHWLGFLQIVQASELTPLANTLTPDLVEFIKRVLD